MRTDTTPMPVPHIVAALAGRAATPGERLRRALLTCGVLSSVYYLAINVYVPLQWEGYSLASQVISELSAIDAPTRPLWVWLGIPYTVLVIAFGLGVWRSAGADRRLRMVGGLLVANVIVGAFWPPMHQRGVEPTLTDALHIAWSVAWLLVMLLAMGFAAAALGSRFRLYTFATLAAFLVFGGLTAIDGLNVAANLLTPWIGLWERINIGAGMLWLAVLAIALLRVEAHAPLTPQPLESGMAAP